MNQQSRIEKYLELIIEIMLAAHAIQARSSEPYYQEHDMMRHQRLANKYEDIKGSGRKQKETP